MNDKPSPGGKILKGCIPLLALFGAVAVAVYLIVPSRVPPGFRVAASVAAAVFISLGLSSFWSLARGFGSGEKSRAALVRRAATGETPDDNEPILATGTVRSLSRPLVAPISGTECVSYIYNMFYWTLDSRRRRIKVPVYWGYASQPFAVDTASSRRTVRAMPQMKHSAEEFPGSAAVERADAIIRSETFEEVDPNPVATVGTVFAAVNEMFTDEDGFTSRHWKRKGDERGAGELKLEETVLPAGATASVLGTWSAARGAIVPDLGSSGHIGVNATTGPADELLASSGQHSFTSYLVTAIILTLIGAGIVWFAVNVLPDKVPWRGSFATLRRLP
ncbi:MAG: hypothetical protein JJE51_05230 [Thermoanaerobaculia bacterium]|nr:hypothetical protein [Thermoanaerobaculia bacterium]